MSEVSRKYCGRLYLCTRHQRRRRPGVVCRVQSGLFLARTVVAKGAGLPKKRRGCAHLVLNRNKTRSREAVSIRGGRCSSVCCCPCEEGRKEAPYWEAIISASFIHSRSLLRGKRQTGQTKHAPSFVLQGPRSQHGPPLQTSV